MLPSLRSTPAKGRTVNTAAIDHPPFVAKRLLSVADYRLMFEAGMFAPDERVELIEGEIVNVPPSVPTTSVSSTI